ncbi:MAG: DoxX family protein [Ignavibacteriales bacterium]
MKWLYNSFVNSSVVILILRIILGIIFFAHGSQKVLGLFGGKGLGATVLAFSTNLNIPPFLIYLAAFTEFLGGLLLILGLLTRIASAGIVIDMAVAIIQIHLKNGFFNPAGIEFPLALLIIAFCVFLYGAGKYSIDSTLAGRFSSGFLSTNQRL